MTLGATYRGVHSSDFGLTVRTNPMILPDHTNNLVEVPGYHGAHYSKSEYGVGVIPLEITLMANNIYDYSTRLRALANWLRPDLGVGEYIADHEPDKVYYAVLESASMSRIELIARMGEGTINLICPDPFAYGQERTYTLSRSTTIANEGTANTNPVFDLTVTEDTSLISITNTDNQTSSGEPREIILGESVSVGETPVKRRELVMHDTMQSTAGWQGASDVDNGYVSGSFVTDDEGFYVETWGDEDYNEEEDGPINDWVWIGPSLQKSLPPLRSFIADIHIRNMNEWNLHGNKLSGDVTGIIEVYMRDANGNMVCKMQFGDTFLNLHQNFATFVTEGNRYQEYNGKAWNNFDGVIRIMRDSAEYYPYVAMIDKNGNHHNIKDFGRIQLMRNGVSNNDVTSIQVAMRKPYGRRRMLQRIKEIKVYSTVGAYEFPDNSARFEFNAGDRLHIDVAKGLVLLNGEPRNDLFALETDFFTLVEGLNTIELSDSVEGSITFRNRYL